MPTLARASPERELQRLIRLYLKAETDIINEIGRLRSRGLVDYHAVAALERVQEILRKLETDEWEYVPRMVEAQFYVHHPEARTIPGETVEKHLRGYTNAQSLTSTQTDIVQKLTMNLMGQLVDGNITVLSTLQSALLGRTEPDVYRRIGLEQVAAQQAVGRGVNQSVPAFVDALRRDGVTAFTDKAGRNWSLHTYATMVSRTTSRQAEILSVVTQDEGQDLYQISAHGTTCALCAPYEGRVYSKSGKDPHFPPLSDAFGKVDPAGPDDLTNSWLNIHPNCLVGGGFVLAEGVMAHSCREYNGPVIRLVTASGNEISVTPNHPILTLRGFVPAGSLHERDKVVEATGKYAVLLRKTPNDVYVPTRVEEIPHAVIEPGGSTSVRVEGSPIQFHGDGIPNSKVDIVFSDSLRVNVRNALGGKPIGKPRFPSTHFRRMRFFSFGAPLQILKCAFFPFNGFVRRFGLVSGIEGKSVQAKKLSNIGLRTVTGIGDFRKSHSLLMQNQKLLKFVRSGCDVFRRNIQKLFSVTLRIGNNPIINTSSFDCGLCYSEMLRNLSISEPLTAQRLQSLFSDGALVVSELIHVSTSQYQGKVYNLQTEFGFYTYNNIVTHNCLHALRPWTPAGRTEKELEQIRRFSDPRTNPYSRDPRTKAQIEAYRKKEQGRSKWLRDYRQWENYRIALGDKVPKTFETFQRHKLADDEKYHKWMNAYRSGGDAD